MLPSNGEAQQRTRYCVQKWLCKSIKTIISKAQKVHLNVKDSMKNEFSFFTSEDVLHVRKGRQFMVDRQRTGKRT